MAKMKQLVKKFKPEYSDTAEMTPNISAGKPAPHSMAMMAMKSKQRRTK